MAKIKGSAAAAAPIDSEPTTLPAIQARLDAIAAAMVFKGLREPDANFRMTANCEPRVGVNWRGKGHGYDLKFESFETFAAADAWAAALPTPEQARMKEFLSSLDETIQLGKKADVEVEAINPLLEIFKRVSKNAITHQAA